MPFPLAELVAGDVEKAAAYLAGRRSAVRAGERTWAEKRADGASDVLSGLGKAVTSNPVLGKALIGGGLGALAGGASHYLGGDEGDPRAKRRGVLSSALTGGLAGAALGGGFGLAQRGLAGSGGAGGPQGGTPGVGEFVHNGQRYRIDPQVLRNNPELLQRAISASSGPGLVESALPAALHGFWNNPVAPWSARILPGVGAVDAIMARGRRGVRDLQGGLREMIGSKGHGGPVGENPAAFNALAGNEGAMRDLLHGPRPVSGNALQRGGGHVRNFFRRIFGGEARGDFTVPEARTQTQVLGKDHAGKLLTERVPLRDAAGNEIRQSVSRDLANEARHLGRNARLGAKLNLPRMTGRALFYGGIPLAEWGLTSLANEHTKARDIREMMRQYARPVS